ncbi:alpha/beta fold hydrolase [Actinocorallia sp. A-T 12471]|uniref:alpha/beta fold hydrolase n=1 Tax=Actinocorallia sp. A-T 12471 TaxID=3089813 RepID=UPI0029CFC25F|nr:alpha/beta fold hydrolase [Actinocorallia sp. A-T 12471]MDX6740043.1 alpha/beta fold hydrolase [Actinocorallia sp. A-T 12471]
MNVRGTEYAYIEAGSGPLLLLAHGLLGGKELYAPQLAALSDSYRCVAFDWPGHGGTGFSPDGWTADDLVADVPALIAALGEERAHLAGVSQGGAVAVRTALARPEVVASLTIMCAGPSGPAPEGLAGLRALTAALAADPDGPERRARAAAFTRSAFHDPGMPERDPEAFEAELDVLLAHPRAALELLPGVPASYGDITPRLGEVKVPTLVIWGESDPRPALGAVVADAIPGARLVTVPAAGHHVNMDAPAEVSATLRAFLADVA